MAERPTSSVQVEWQGGFKFAARDTHGHSVIVDAPQNAGDEFAGRVNSAQLLRKTSIL